MQTCICGDICVNTTGWWRDYKAFNAGETICVWDGTYNENVNVAHLTIRSENGSVNCTVNAVDSDDHVFEVTADYVNISGFTVENATGGGRLKAGICLIGRGYISNGSGTLYM